MKSKNVALSAIAICMLGTNTYAGKIKTDADLNDIQISENKQFGFEGWNYDNIDVRIVNIADFSTAIPGSSFDKETGIYTPMTAGTSFESDIKDITYEEDGSKIIGSTVLGHLHGKDWPVGEPSGIKIINDDMKTSNGKPTNCIMTTSYLETGYLDAYPDLEPVLCSSPFQTHKRYKINLLPTTVETLDNEGYGKPVDLVFNLDSTDTDTTIRKYQVLQKANNYTGKRLDGYKVEVLDENGSVNDALTLSLGIGEGLDENGDPDSNVNIWDEEDMANMSHGLWGPYQTQGNEVRFDNGFFDYKRAYYDVALNDKNNTISHIGPMLGGNYQELFGNWLPSIWEPLGIFHDDDEDPATDGVLKAFLGVAPGYEERNWYKSVVTYDPDTPSIKPVYAWLPATDEDLETWKGDWYAEGPIEDVLNLGLNYIINVGENAKIGSTFILRITPHVDDNQTLPSSYAPDPGVVVGTGNFDADANADILWKNARTNEVSIWYMNADGTYEESNIGTVTTDLTVEGTGDFTDDNIADILWRNTLTNEIIIWNMNADGTHTENILGTVASELNIEGTGDINSNGLTDILWRDTSTQEISFWYTQLDGSYVSEPLYVTGTSWKIEEVADLDGNGQADILWRSKGNAIAITYMEPGGTYAEVDLYGTNGKWLVETTGDFDGNTAQDILWKNSQTQEVAITNMGTDRSYTETTLYVTSSTWDIESAADFDADGSEDILWRNNPTTGTLSEIGISYMIDGMEDKYTTVETINK